MRKRRFADGGNTLTGSYTDPAFGLTHNASNPYSYGMGPEELMVPQRPASSSSNSTLLQTYDPVAAAKQGYASLSDADKFYLRKKWGLWSGKAEDTGEKGVADTLEDINRIIAYKGGQTVQDYNQVSPALQPLIAKRNAKGGLGGILGMVAPIALSFIAPGIGTALGTALGATGAAASALGGGLMGAGLGGLTSAISGGNVLQGALMGGVGGGFGGYLGSGGINGLSQAGGFANAAKGAYGPFQATTGNILSGVGSRLSSLGNLGRVASSAQDLLGMFNPQQSQQQQQTQLTLTPEMARMLLTYGNNGVGTSYGVNPMMAMGRTFAKGGSVQTSPRLIQGPGDGMSDGIATSINGVEPAALSDSEHVTPALQVSLLGRGSPQAGSERIQALIDKEIKRMYGEGIDAVDMQDKAMRKQ